MEANQIDVLAPPVFRDFEKVDDSLETRGARDGGRDVGIANREDRVHLDLTLLHPVAVADRHAGTHPYADTAGDLAAPNSLTQALGKEHAKSLSGTKA